MVPSESAAVTDETDPRRRQLDGSVPSWYREAWPELRTVAIPTFYDARVRINLQGRERGGGVPLEEDGRFRSRVEAWIRSSRDARTGRPAVDDVCSKVPHDIHGTPLLPRSH
jgi:hypothetical protein